MKATLTLIQYKEIIEAMKSKYGIDLSQYAISSLNYTFIALMNELRLYSHSSFIKSFTTNVAIKEKLFSRLINESVGLFREPSLWRIMKKEIFDVILSKGNLKIWLPELSNASDLYTLLIVLDYYKLRSKARITVSDLSNLNIDASKKGELSRDILSNSILNLKHFNPDINIADYTYQVNKQSYINKELLMNVYSVKGDFFEAKPSYSPNLVLFRNRMIYYNHVREQKAINFLHKTMSGGGFLFVGIKEDLTTFEINKKFRLLNKDEQIYKRNF